MGSMRFRPDLPCLYQRGRVRLDELVSNRITLKDINEGYAASSSGSIARSVAVFS
jgi:S-(hydroxymethyl)glutathione dehydrogenase / alcohol dehydrogenase